jgi:hypothetical protein
VVRGTTEGDRLVVNFDQTDRAGIYRATLAKLDGTKVERMEAWNVESAEGEMSLAKADSLREQIPGVEFRWLTAGSLTQNMSNLGASNIQDTLLWLILAALVLEQGVAYWASFHLGSAKEVDRG